MVLGSDLVWRAPGKPRVAPKADFLPLMRAAVEAHPDDPDLLLDLMIALRDAGQYQEIVDRLVPIAAERGLAPELAVELGAAARRCGAIDSARMALESAMDERASGQTLRDPRGRDAARRRARVELAFVLAASGGHDAALHMLRDALDRDPRHDAALGAMADMLLKRGEAAALLIQLDHLEARGIGSTLSLAARANALGALGAHAELEQLVCPQRWCEEARIDASEIDNHRLAEVILRHPGASVSPGDRATQGSNLRLDALASRPEPEICAVVATIRRHIDAYVAARRGISHPLMARMPAAAVLQGWALATRAGGHEARHFHPKSWITAVYYVRVPPIGPDGPAPQPGALVFGPWPAGDPVGPGAFPGWHIAPQEGMLVIFPSFLAHRTIPCDAGDYRLCVTLDVMPRDLRA